MARSNCVYVVMDEDLPVAGFTVKHELVSWVRRYGYEPLTIWRLKDNPDPLYGDSPRSEITEEIMALAEE